MKKPLKILFFGNIETSHMVKWAKYFALQKHDVHVLSFAGDEACVRKTGIKLHVINVKSPVQLLFRIGEIRKLTRRIAPDVVHGHYVGLYGLAAALSGFAPLVQTAWGSDILISPRNLVKRLFVRYALQKAACITCDAQHMKNAMVQLGVPQKKIRLIMFGVDTKKFVPAPRSAELSKKLGLPETSFVIVSLRSFYPVYDIPTLIRAAADIVKENPAAKVVLVGGGPQEEELRRLVKTLSLEGCVVFAGKVPYNDIPDYVRLGSVYVSTSLSDGGLASSTAEAMASGVPVVISDNLDNKLWVSDGVNGGLFRPGDPHSLAEQVLKFADSPAIARSCAAAGRATIIARDDYYGEMRKMEEIYFEMLKTA